MGLAAVYKGHQSWSDYISARDCLGAFEKAIELEATNLQNTTASLGMMKVALRKSDYQIALESGIGALGSNDNNDAVDPLCSIELAFQKLAGGLDQLNADFNFLLGDVIWKIEMHGEGLSNLLSEISIVEFVREERAYSRSAEKS